MRPLLPATLVLVAFLVAIAGWYLVRHPGVAAANRVGLVAGDGDDDGPSLLLKVSMRLSPVGLRVMGQGYATRMSREIVMAGSPGGLTIEVFAGHKTMAAMLTFPLSALCVLNGNGLLAVILLAAGLGLLDIWVITAAHERQRVIEDALPDFLDVLAVTVSGGVSFRSGFGKVVQLTDGPLEDEMSRTLREMGFGTTRRRAFENLRDRNTRSPSLATFVGGVLQAEELGAPLVDSLITLTDDMRRSRSEIVKRTAQRVESRLTLVTTVLILPAVLLVVGVMFFLSTEIDLSIFTGGF